MKTGNTNNHISSKGSKWIKAAALGSIWAAIEIIAGSFLHNLNVPFSGTMLSMVAVYLLVAFSMQWKETGIIIRAGMIAALMKSVSPSAIILGPMVGIMIEAVIMELSIYILGRNLAGYVVGGIFAVSWALFQKVINLLILYGFDLVKILEAFYHFLVKITGLQQVEPLHLGILIVSVYGIAGLSVATISFFHYRKVESGILTLKLPEGKQVQDNPFLFNTEKQKYAAYNILIIAIGLAVTMLFLNRNQFYYALIPGSALILYALLKYTRSMRYLKKPTLWIQLFLITFIAALSLEWAQTGKILTKNGLLAGLEINFRALVIILSFSSISVELRSPLVRSLLYRTGFSNLYKAISMSFMLLPTIIEKIPPGKKIFQAGRGGLKKVLLMADLLSQNLEKQMIEHTNIFLVTGKVGEGKTSFLQRFINKAKEKGHNIHGFIAPGYLEGKVRSRFDLKDISNENLTPLAKKEFTPGWEKFRKYYFNPKAFKEGERIIETALRSSLDVIIIDEIGALEMNEKGWSKLLRMLDRNYTIPQIWSVRKSLIDEVAARWQVPDENIHNITDDDIETFFQKVFQDKDSL